MTQSDGGDIDLFAEASPLRLCSGCGRYFEETEVKRCRVCGEYFCAECQKTHDCRLPPVYVPAPNPAAAPQTLPDKPDDSRQKQMKESTAESLQSEQSHDEGVCDSCGLVFPKTALKRCRTCGAVLCPDCRKHHHCSKQTGKPHRAHTKKQSPGTKKKSKKLLILPIIFVILIAIVFIVPLCLGIVPFGLYYLVHEDISQYKGTPVSASQLMVSNPTAVSQITSPNWHASKNVLGVISTDFSVDFRTDGTMSLSGVGNMPSLGASNMPISVYGNWVYLGDNIYQFQGGGITTNFKYYGDSISFALNPTKMGVADMLKQVGLPEGLLNIDIPIELKK